MNGVLLSSVYMRWASRSLNSVPSWKKVKPRILFHKHAIFWQWGFVAFNEQTVLNTMGHNWISSQNSVPPSLHHDLEEGCPPTSTSVIWQSSISTKSKEEQTSSRFDWVQPVGGIISIIVSVNHYFRKVCDRKGREKTILGPAVSWKCQAWENWVSWPGAYPTCWETLLNNRLNS